MGIPESSIKLAASIVRDQNREINEIISTDSEPLPVLPGIHHPNR